MLFRMETLPIALDAMGSDFGPGVVVAGAMEAAQLGIPVLLVGDEAQVQTELKKYPQNPKIQIHHTSDFITMDEHASDVRRRPEASINVCTRLVKEGKAGAAVSMGHSGATMASALFTLGRIKGVDRPAIMAYMPSQKGFCALLDVGANADIKAPYLQQWAVLASAYYQAVHNRARPSVGLLSIGEEEHKGSALVLEAHPLLKQTPEINFYGNVEGKDIFKGTTDIIVTDGFTGNVVLKTAEGEAKVLMGWIKEALTSTFVAKIGALLARPALKKIAERVDPSEYGASVLLGVQGLVFIGHGSGDAKAVKNAVRVAHEAYQKDVLGKLKSFAPSASG